MRHLAAVMLLLVGILHLLPVTGALGTERLVALYGVAVDEPNVAILMRHRAVLFGLLGAFIALAAFRPPLRPLAFTAGFISVAGFLVIAGSVGGYNDLVRRVVLADALALVCLAIGTAAHFYERRKG